jgi:PAS domain S-box-containing protein
MEVQGAEMAGGRVSPQVPVAASGLDLLSTAIGVVALLLAAASLGTSIAGMRSANELLGLAGLTSAAFLVMRRKAAMGVTGTVSPRHVLDSAGAAMLVISAEGHVTYANPAAERLLGYRGAELRRDWRRLDILAPGDGTRLVEEIQKLCGVDRPVAETPTERMAAYLECVRMLPPSMVPTFETRVRSRAGMLIPATLHVSALRNPAGTFDGLVVVAMDQSATRHDHAQQELQERYRDLFENAPEMIATLSPSGRFLDANSGWKRSFGRDRAALLELDSFELLFEGSTRTEVADLLRRVMEGGTIDRFPLRHPVADGRPMYLELSLSRRQEAGLPFAVRCLLRDVTQQKQRENRLALQLAVSQIAAGTAPLEIAAMRMLEALCVSQDWDLAIHWGVDHKGEHLEFSTAWGKPGRASENLIRESMGVALPSGGELPGRAWREARAVWMTDLAAVAASPRVHAAVRQEMASGWAVPVRVGGQVLAVLEFYSRIRLREDAEAMAAVETVTVSLGQMMAQTLERSRAEELSRQQQILLDSVTDGICGVDRQGRVSFANPAAARLLMAPAVSLRGKPVHELLHGGPASGRICGDECGLRRAADGNKPASGEETVFRADGSGFPAEYVLTPILEQGRFSGSVLSFRDISQRSALDKLKDEFISTVSHELRTPLTSIRGALGLLSSGILGQMNEKAANLMRIAVANSDRLVRLINDILDLERIQSGREPLAFRPVQLAEIVRQAIDGMQPVADAAGVQLIHDAIKAEVLADPDRLLQVLTNLLSNAVKFSPPNTTVSIMLRPGNTGVTLSVIDHGRGIPADKLESIFGRFQQVDASDSRQKGGSGLGLAICRTIVLQHSGRIWAERNPVRGSTFRVFLPFRPEPLEGHVGEPETSRRGDETQPAAR